MIGDRRLSLRRKLVAAFLVITALVAVTGAVGYTGLTTAHESAQHIYQDELPVADASMEMRLAIEAERAALHAYLLGETEAREEFRAATEDFQRWHDRLAAREDLTAEERDLLAAIGDQHARSTDLAVAAMNAYDKGQTGTVQDTMEAYDAVQSNLVPATGRFEKLAGAEMAAAIDASEAIQRRTTLAILGLTGIAILLGIGLGAFVSRRITGPVEALRDAAEDLARGDVHASFAVDAENDEIGDMVDAFADMRSYLQTVADQASAIAAQDFDDPVLEEDVPGTFGETIDAMRDDIETAQAEVQAAKAEVEAMNDAIERTADEYAATMERAAEGDLTQRMDPESESEAMTHIGETFNDMLADLEGTVGRVQSFAEEVAAASETVTATTGEIQSASEQVSESVQEIADRSVEQDQHLQEVSGEMSTLSGTIEEVAASAEQVATTAGGAVERGHAGSEHAADALEEMAAIEARAEDTIDEVAALEREVAEIGEIADMIGEIAEQTNLLALNANIEAGRAAEAGEGFAVVAAEVKSLAEEAAAATDDIERRLDAVQSTTGDAVDTMEDLAHSVETGSDTIEDALAALDDVVEGVEEANDGIQEISDATDEQAASTEEVVSMVDEVATLSRDTAEETETVSAAAEEQTASLSDVTDHVDRLADGADDLATLVASFEADRAGE
ncbi:MAG: methyl-accepting chemotaxis protein [Halanaeroarchaeum sp.]